MLLCFLIHVLVATSKIQTNVTAVASQGLAAPALTPPHALKEGEMLKDIGIAKWHREGCASVINWKIGAKGETASSFKELNLILRTYDPWRTLS